MATPPRKRWGWFILVALLLLLGLRAWYVFAVLRRFGPAGPLTLAVRQSDIATVQALLKSGTDPNSLEDGPWVNRSSRIPLLFYSIQRGDYPMVKTLLDGGANPNMTDKLGRTPLMLTVVVHRADIAQLLLERGAKLETKNQVGKTALYSAIEHGEFATYPEFIKLLLAHHADVNTTNKKGMTPLMLAAQQNDGFLCFQLLAHGANLNARDNGGQTALWFALESNSKQTAQDLLRYHAAWEKKDRDKLLLAACWCGLSDFARTLLDAGANINARDDRGNTPLMRALSRNHDDIARMLLERGADGKQSNYFGGSPILAAAGNKNPLFVQTLLKQGADPKIKRLDGFTPLMFAASRGNLQTVKLLLSQGAEVNVRDTNKVTALSLAKEMQARWDSPDQAKLRSDFQRRGQETSEEDLPYGERRYAETIASLQAAGAVE